MGCSYDEFIKGLRCHIADPDAEIWKAEAFESYVLDAYNMLVGVRPEYFAENKTVTLKGGECRHTFECECILSVVSVNGFTCDTPDKEAEDITKANTYLEKCFPNNCVKGGATDEGTDPAATYNPDSYVIEGKNQTTVVFKDPPPSDVEAVICCAPKWELECGGDLPAALCGALAPGFRALVLHNAYLADHQSLTNIKLAEIYYQRYQDWLGNQRLMAFSKEQPDFSHGLRVTAQ